MMQQIIEDFLEFFLEFFPEERRWIDG